MVHRPLLGLLLLAGFGCTAPGESLAWRADPAVETTIDHFQGSPFSGPGLGIFTESPADLSVVDALGSLAVAGEFFFSAETVVEGWPSLESSARLITDPLAAQPILVRGRLLEDVHVLSFPGPCPLVEQVASVVRMESLSGILDRGMTCELLLTDPGQPGRPEVIALQLHRPAEGGELLATMASRRLDQSGQLLHWEQAVLAAAPAVDGSGLALAVPANDGSGVFVIAVTVQRAPTEPELFARHGEQVAAARLQAGLRHEGMEDLLRRYQGKASMPTDLLAALSGLGEAAEHGLADQRGVVLYLASATAAELAYDLALVGDEGVLTVICDDARAALAEGATPDPRSLAWILDRAGWRALAEIAGADDPELGLTSVLLRHAGEVGRDPSLLLELTEAATDRLSFDSLLLSENLASLAVNVPAARVRAFDWLLSRGQAPAGYAPHAGRQLRRAALKRFAETGETRP